LFAKWVSGRPMPARADGAASGVDAHTRAHDAHAGTRDGRGRAQRYGSGKFGSWYAWYMCVTKLLLTSGCGARIAALPSPVGGNTSGSPYRVLRGSPRGALRSVDRDCSGRNAKSVKVSSPDKQLFPWWPSVYGAAKAVSDGPRVPCVTAEVSPSGRTPQRRPSGTTGVQVHGMYRRPAVERERSARGRAMKRPRLRVSEQGVTTEFKTIPRAEVRCLHSSEEVG
jgi:hypothetical protein